MPVCAATCMWVFFFLYVTFSRRENKENFWKQYFLVIINQFVSLEYYPTCTSAVVKDDCYMYIHVWGWVFLICYFSKKREQREFLKTIILLGHHKSICVSGLLALPVLGFILSSLWPGVGEHHSSPPPPPHMILIIRGWLPWNPTCT